MSSSDFYETYVRTSTPTVITDMMLNWNAIKKWNFYFFRDLKSHDSLHIEIGNVVQDQTIFIKDKIGSYIEREIIHNPDVQRLGKKPYLSALSIFKTFPYLKNDVDFQLLASKKVKNITLAWIGPGGTITGFHTDWADNLIAQVVGRKEFLLVAPKYNSQMYLSSKYDFRSKLSLINTRESIQKFPLFQNVEIFQTTLNPGEMLFVPRRWWHHVEALEASITVNNFGLSIQELIVDELREQIKALLHKIGLLAYENCTCHMHRKGVRVSR